MKSECVFVVRPSAGTLGSMGNVGMHGTGGVPNRVVDVQEKGQKGFVVQTVGYQTALIRVGTEDYVRRQRVIGISRTR